MSSIDELTRSHNVAVEEMHAAAAAIETADESADLDALQGEFDSKLEVAERAKGAVEAREALMTARDAMTVKPVADVKVEVISNEQVYRPDRPERSYFRDLYLSKTKGDREASDRLSGHALATRDINTTDTSGGDFVPPAYLVNEYIAKARAGRVTADLCSKFALPGGTDSINFPAITTGSGQAAQSSQNSALQETNLVTATVTAPVTTIGGIQDVSVQLVEQSPLSLDTVIFADLAAAHAQAVGNAVINGTGASGTLEGFVNADTVNTITYTDASPTAAETVAKIADGISQVATNRFLPADAIVMHPRRFYALCAGVDGGGRPLVVPTAQAMNTFGTADASVAEGAAGNILGLPVYLDPNIATNSGAGTNQDIIIISRFADAYLFEGTPKAEVFRETLSAEATVRFRLYNFLAFTAERYVGTNTSIVSGTGLITPTFA
jgi:HK97 family phage major capsid protein